MVSSPFFCSKAGCRLNSLIEHPSCLTRCLFPFEYLSISLRFWAFPVFRLPSHLTVQLHISSSTNVLLSFEGTLLICEISGVFHSFYHEDNGKRIKSKLLSSFLTTDLSPGQAEETAGNQKAKLIMRERREHLERVKEGIGDEWGTPRSGTGREKTEEQDKEKERVVRPERNECYYVDTHMDGHWTEEAIEWERKKEKSGKKARREKVIERERGMPKGKNKFHSEAGTEHEICTWLCPLHLQMYVLLYNVHIMHIHNRTEDASWSLLIGSHCSSHPFTYSLCKTPSFPTHFSHSQVLYVVN